MNKPLHFNQKEGDHLPPDYFNPPDDGHGVATKTVLAFVPHFPGATARESDHLFYRRIAKGFCWTCEYRTDGRHS